MYDKQFLFISLTIPVVKPRVLRKANLITVLTKNHMERRQGSFVLQKWEENPRELFQEKPMPSVTPDGI